MRTAPTGSSAQDTKLIRDRGDACPGALRLHEADDGAVARVRVPGGVLGVRQAEALVAAARRLGDGDLHLTSRGNVQLRGLDAGCGRELAGTLEAAGLLPSRRHERVRNVVASPLAGLDGHGQGDLRPWLRALDAALCTSEFTHALSGRFLFALDDGRGDMAECAADVTLTAGADGAAWLSIGPRHAVRVPSLHAPTAAVLAAEAFLQTPAAQRGQAWRIADLPAGTRESTELTEAVTQRLGEAGVTATAVEEPAGTGSCGTGTGSCGTGSCGPPAPGVVPGPDGLAALSVLTVLGRTEAAQWETLVCAASRSAYRELRLTPWRGLVLPGLPAGEAAEELRTAASAGLITDPASPRAGVGACIGRPGCAKSLADVRTDAAALTGPGDLPVHWSGCDRRCGNPRGDRVEAVAVPEGYRVRTVRDGVVRSATTASRAAAAAAVAEARTSCPTAPEYR